MPVYLIAAKGDRLDEVLVGLGQGVGCGSEGGPVQAAQVLSVTLRTFRSECVHRDEFGFLDDLRLFVVAVPWFLFFFVGVGRLFFVVAVPWFLFFFVGVGRLFFVVAVSWFLVVGAARETPIRPVWGILFE